MRSRLVLALASVLAVNGVLALVGLALRRRIRSHGDETSDEIALAAICGGIELHSRAGAFRGGSARAIMGGIELDLRGATLDPAGARLELRAVMGGIDVLIPESWAVRVRSKRAVMGGVDPPDGGDSAVADGPVLELSMIAIMGGIGVRRRPPGTDTTAAPISRG